jgi:predicted HicB family RNase H-like nuclease
MAIIMDDESLKDSTKGFSVRFPKAFHNKLKAEAALRGMTKDQLVLELIKLGIQHYEN